MTTLMLLTKFFEALNAETRAWERFTFSITKVDHPHTLFVVRWRGAIGETQYTEAWDVRVLDSGIDTMAHHLLRLIESARDTRQAATK